MNIYLKYLNEFNTGDILLFDNNNPKDISSRIIKYFTGSEYTHIGIILKSPQYLDKKLKGLYFYESTIEESVEDVEDKCKKFGVQLIPLVSLFKKNYKGIISWRKLKTNEPLNKKMLSEIYNKTKNKPYNIDLIDWIAAWKQIKINRKTDSFWCSQLVSFIYTKLNLLKNNYDWTICRPSDFLIRILNYLYKIVN